MSLRGHPYIQFYVQDFLTDEKLSECSALATGVCIKTMCIMHKSEDYGKIHLKEKDKQHGSNIINFAIKLSKHLPWNLNVIEEGLKELIEEGVMQIEGDVLVQKRMIKDYSLSLKRAEAGKIGGNRKRIPTNAAGDK